jgi:hypothetical protein
MNTRHNWQVDAVVNPKTGELGCYVCAYCGVILGTAEAGNICREAPATYGDVKGVVAELLAILGQAGAPHA